MYKLYLIIFCSSLLHINLKCIAAEIESDNAVNNCSILKDNLAKTISEFTMCSIDYSRPITLCEKCIDLYINVLNSYKNMTEVSVNGTECLHYYINLDRLQVLETQYFNSFNLWNQAKCYECYSVVNGTQTSNETDISKKFHSYYDNFINCTENVDPKILCDDCMDDYVVLNNFYKSNSNSNEKIGVCIDLEDLMNDTWKYWSTNCCKYRKHSEYLFIVSTTGVLILTVLLYIVVQFCGEKKAPTIIQQSRFAGSINRF